MFTRDQIGDAFSWLRKQAELDDQAAILVCEFVRLNNVVGACEENGKPLRMREWRSHVIDKLVICGIYSGVHEENPRKALDDLIAFEVQLALNPAVSEDAQKLIQRGREEAQK